VIGHRGRQSDTPLLGLGWEPASGSDGQDLLLYVGGQERQRCDIYYLGLDDSFDGELSEADSVRAVLRRLLEQWVQALRGAGEGEVLFLPYDFFDEGTGCLRCRVLDGEVELVSGFSGRGGYDFLPTDISDFVRSVDDFQPLSSPIELRVERSRLIADLERNVRDVEHMGPGGET